MGHLKALLQKNWILWKRNWFCSFCELIIPLILILTLGLIRMAVDKKDIVEANFYDPNNFNGWTGPPFLVQLYS